MLFLSRCTEASSPTRHFPCSDLFLSYSSFSFLWFVLALPIIFLALISYPTHHFPCSDLVLGMSPTSTHCPWFQDVPKILMWDSNCWNWLLLFFLLRQGSATSCHTHLSSTRRHWHISQAHFAFNLWGFFSLFACTFILIMQHPPDCGWESLSSQWWHCWSATALIITAYRIHLALPNPEEEWELLMA